MTYLYYELQGGLVKGLTTAIFRMPDGAFIPLDEGNGDYRRYLQWVDQGNVAPIISNPDEGREDPEALQLIEAMKAEGSL